MRLKVEFDAGEQIERACEAAIRLAEQLFCTVEFDFNGVTCLADGGGDPALLAQRQQEEQGRKPRNKYDLKFARSRP